ncbi:thiJ/pfpI family protein [Vibrio ishigakensis]|uniref:ThiJ/pfpI family protein n=1 Tax=Vibrio ishigakensis TaxID=1481914 RepID=A0A0B8QCJ0_9VIBR|nr:thiJ/pfpI family protein [Vibrio ishigakensis]
MKVLMVLTSHDKLGDSGHATGFWLEEFTTPYYTFLDAGADITLASPKGGLPPIDPNSTQEDAQTETTKRYDADQDLKSKLANTLELSGVSADDFDAIFYPGGHGPLWDLSEDKDSIALIEAFSAQAKPVGAVCHGPAVFRHPKGADGKPLVSGKRVTGFSNEEEEAVGLTQVVPFLIEDMFAQSGATYSRGDTWQSHVVTDGLLVTGQNPASSDASAKAVLALL